MKKALNKWCLPATMPISEAIELCARIGYDGLELNIEADGELNWQTPVSVAEVLARQAAAAGLQLPSISTSLHWRYPLTSTNPELRDRGMAVARQQIEVASAVGADTVLLVVGLVTEEDAYDAVWERGLAALQELAPLAAQRGVHIGVENVGNQFLLSPLEMRDFVDAVGSPWVGAYLDIGNVALLRQAWPEHWVRILGPRIRKVHVKDFVAVGRSGVGVPLLAGDLINWPGVMAALSEVGYDSYLTVEISPYKFYPTKLAYDALTSLNTLLAGG